MQNNCKGQRFLYKPSFWWEKSRFEALFVVCLWTTKMSLSKLKKKWVPNTDSFKENGLQRGWLSQFQKAKNDADAEIKNLIFRNIVVICCTGTLKWPSCEMTISAVALAHLSSNPFSQTMLSTIACICTLLLYYHPT